MTLVAHAGGVPEALTITQPVLVFSVFMVLERRARRREREQPEDPDQPDS